MHLTKRILQTLILLFAVTSAAVAADRINTLDRSGLWGYKPSGIAVRGYDPVAYFTAGKPTKGKEKFETEWNGARWLFASKENRDLFIANPEKYAPQYGGYCAYGVAEGNLVKIEVDQWSIVDGKLYLNYDKGIQNKWLKDVSGYINSANGKFERLLAE
ncbi:hypothetical protein AB833_26315 [Chromatiales bacterium (ex Bugula neritina AB1)]|nr:hypothetical protein AB833_26315 [Chromatiales bacterium (ex Bugula neritina AB1)]